MFAQHSSESSQVESPMAAGGLVLNLPKMDTYMPKMSTYLTKMDTYLPKTDTYMTKMDP